MLFPRSKLKCHIIWARDVVAIAVFLAVANAVVAVANAAVAFLGVANAAVAFLGVANAPVAVLGVVGVTDAATAATAAAAAATLVLLRTVFSRELLLPFPAAIFLIHLRQQLTFPVSVFGDRTFVFPNLVVFKWCFWLLSRGQCP